MAAHSHQLARPDISQAEFAQFQRFIYNAAGITLSDAKKALVSGRLAKRLAHCGVSSYGEYFRLLDSGAYKEEVQEAIDLLTTNETYFFREAKHFELLRERALSPQRPRGETFRVWSAACSSGEECYSIAMVLADCLGERPWEIMGSDICTKVLHKARIGHYPMERARHIPQPLLRKYCLKGQDSQEGTMLVESSLRRRVQFGQINLNTALPQLGQFDMVFLRNVMIYFNGDTKRQVVDRISALLKPHGCLVIGLAESLSDTGAMVKSLAPSIYVRA